MDIVVDANILFAALIKEGETHALLFKENLNLFTPEYIFTEFENHKEEILEKTERTAEEFFRIFEIFKGKIRFIPLEELTEYVAEAEQLTPDPDDLVYFALALKLRCAIWSNDKKIKKQNIITVYSTHELKKLFEL